MHQTSYFSNPGVGEYNVANTTLEIKPKSPRATIGKQARFEKDSSIKAYIS